MDDSCAEVTGNGVLLCSSWEYLPASHLGVGIDLIDGALLAWCAPKLGRITCCEFADGVDLDRLHLTSWLMDQGFGAEEAAAASCELVSRLNAMSVAERRRAASAYHPS